MDNHDAETAVTDWVIDHPASETVFRELGIDYSCGGMSLETACLERGLGVKAVIQRIREAMERNKLAQERRASS